MQANQGVPTVFGLLGEFVVAVDGEHRDVAGHKVRLLLAILATQRTGVVSADVLTEALWGSEPAAEAGARLQAVVSRARRAIAGGGAIEFRSGGYLLAGCAVDVERRSELARSGAQAAAGGDLASATSDLRAALALRRGPALAEFGDCAYFQAEAVRLEETHRQLTERLADVLMSAGRTGEAVEVLEPHVAAHPFREEAAATLIVALHRCGRRADALAAYRSVRDRITDELGLDPGPELRRAEALVLAGTSEEVVAIDTTSSDATRSRLPIPGGTFLGRETELRELVELAKGHRLITLWGPGGAGKTRLAIELAVRSADEFADGVWFVSLAPVEEVDQVAPATMSAMGMLSPHGEDALSTLVDNLRQRQALIVLDNCEHLLDGAARVAHSLLVGCPGIAVIATSREPLLVPDECVWPARSLSLPPAGADPTALAASDAGALFADRAALASPGFALDPVSAPLVAEICRRLEGIPLALELAAARVRALGVHGVAERLDDQFALLTAGHRTADTRHRTMRAAIDWSVDLAPPDEQALLRCLSVFPVTFDLDGAGAVRDPADRADRETAEVLAGLVDRSLVHPVGGACDGRRFRLLEPIRQYAAERLERLGQGDATRDRHLYLLVDGLPDGLTWFDHSRAWQQAGRHHESITAATAWAIRTANGPAAVRLVGQLWPLWAYTGEPPENVEAWTDRALALPGAVAPRDAAIALTAKIFRTGDLSLVPRVLQLAEGLDDADEIEAFVRWATALVLQRTDPAGSRAALEDLLDDAARFRPGMLRSCHHQLAWIAVAADDLERARRHVEAAIDMLDAEHPFWAHYLAARARILAMLGEHAQAEESARGALAVSYGTVWDGQLALVLSQAAMVAQLAGNHVLAETRLRELLHLLRRLCTSRWVRDAVHIAVLILDETHRPAHVVALLDAVDDPGAVNETPGGTLPVVARAVEAARERALRATGSRHQRPRTVDDVLSLALRALDSPR